MVATNLVHRDFSPLIASYGDTVNTRRPSKFTAIRKTGTENVTDQDAVATNVPVVLDQLFHVTFVIYDSEASKSFKDLVTEYMRPAMLAHAQALDKVVLGQVGNFMGNSYGYLNALSVSNATDGILGTREIMNRNLAYVNGRNLILTPSTETTLLNLPIFTQANQVGDSGQALQNAWIGRKYGFNTYMCQHMSSVAVTPTVDATYRVNGAHAAGATTLALATGTSLFDNNTWFTVVGSGVPHRVLTGGQTTATSITFTPALQGAVSTSAVVTFTVPGAVDLVAGYAAGYNKEINVDTLSVVPKIGQLVSFSNTANSPVYTIINVNTYSGPDYGLTLDRSLETALVDGQAVNLSPMGEYNFAFHRNAIALVTRPMELPRQGIGAASANVNYNGLSVRVVLT